jgi:hypothetical protein
MKKLAIFSLPILMVVFASFLSAEKNTSFKISKQDGILKQNYRANIMSGSGCPNVEQACDATLTLTLSNCQNCPQDWFVVIYPVGSSTQCAFLQGEGNHQVALKGTNPYNSYNISIGPPNTNATIDANFNDTWIFPSRMTLTNPSQSFVVRVCDYEITE